MEQIKTQLQLVGKAVQSELDGNARIEIEEHSQYGYLLVISLNPAAVEDWAIIRHETNGIRFTTGSGSPTIPNLELLWCSFQGDNASSVEIGFYLTKPLPAEVTAKLTSPN